LPKIDVSVHRLCSLGHEFTHAVFYHATHATHASAVLVVVILSVCLSVHQSHACFVTKPNNAVRIFWYHTKGQWL